MRRTNALVLTTCLLASAAANAQSNTMFIIDGSGSMWGQLGDKAKIETAKEALSDMLSSMPADSKVGLMAYGHNKKEDCGDIEVLAPIGSSSEEISKQLTALNPKGKTPITDSLKAAVDAFPGGDEANNLVLVSDGKETCGGDPCAAAGELAKKGINVKIHVVGFDVQGEEKQQLECIAKAGGGSYFDANSTEGFKQAVASVQEEVQQAPPPAPEVAKPAFEEYFFDDFDGEDLEPHWTINNPDPNNYIVENGELLIVTSSAVGPASDDFVNLFILDKELPKGDYILSARVNIDYQTQKEAPSLFLFADKDNFLQVHATAWQAWKAPCDKGQLCQFLTSVKRAGAKDSSFAELVYRSAARDGKDYATHVEELPQPLQIRIVRKGREYTASIYHENAAEPKWIELDSFRILRQKGKPALGLYQTAGVKGESAMTVDWVKIEAASK